MGGICDHPSERQNILYTTKSLSESYSGFRMPRFYFSTEPLFKLDAQCLLIMSNDSSNLNKNPFISKMMKKSCADRVCSEFKKFTKGRKLQQREFVIFSVSIIGLDYTKICVFHLSDNQIQEIYEQNNALTAKEKFLNPLSACIQQIMKENIISLVITEFCWNSWIHKNNGFKVLAKLLVQKNHFKAAVFACLTQQSQILSMKTVQQVNNSSE